MIFRHLDRMLIYLSQNTIPCFQIPCIAKCPLSCILAFRLVFSFVPTFSIVWNQLSHIIHTYWQQIRLT